MRVTILGNNSALPAHNRHPTAQSVSIEGEEILLDCGEGTQLQMQRYGIRWRLINRICISHMHGDHYFGLPGLINSMSLLGRTAPLHVYGPSLLKQFIDITISGAEAELGFPLLFHDLNPQSDLLADTHNYRLESFPVTHRIQCHGFKVSTKTKGRRLLPEKCVALGVPMSSYESIKKGEDYITVEGNTIPNGILTEDGPEPRTYAYCADTLYSESVLPFIDGVHTIYHESTYLEADSLKAAQRFHSTARQAAMIAKKSHANLLLLGHFSSKHKELSAFKVEASAIFPNVVVTEEGVTYPL